MRAEAMGKEHEGALVRHQEFIDRLLGDKKALAAKVEEVAGELKKAEERFTKQQALALAPHSPRSSASLAWRILRSMQSSARQIAGEGGSVLCLSFMASCGI